MNYITEFAQHFYDKFNNMADLYWSFIFGFTKIVLVIWAMLFLLLFVLGFFCLVVSVTLKIFRGYSRCIKFLKSKMGKATVQPQPEESGKSPEL